VLYARPRRRPSPDDERIGRQPLRIGFSISKKTAKKASVRNRLKRRLREISRRVVVPILRKDALYDVVVVARASAPEAGFATLAQEMTELFKQAKVT
jgi:ribonuclease P protein component